MRKKSVKRKAIATKKQKRKNNCNGGTNGRACVVCFFLLLLSLNGFCVILLHIVYILDGLDGI